MNSVSLQNLVCYISSSSSSSSPLSSSFRCLDMKDCHASILKKLCEEEVLKKKKIEEDNRNAHYRNKLKREKNYYRYRWNTHFF